MEADKYHGKKLLKCVKGVKEYRFTILNRGKRVDFKVKVIFEQRLDGVEEIFFNGLRRP